MESLKVAPDYMAFDQLPNYIIKNHKMDKATLREQMRYVHLVAYDLGMT